MTPAKFEPPDGFVLHGAGQDSTGFEQYMQAIPSDLTPAMSMSYLALHPDLTCFRAWRGFTRAEVRDAMARYPNCAQQLALSMVIPDGRKGLEKYHYEARVASGEFDRYVAEVADLCAAHAAPVFIRPGFECNGHWNAYDPPTYVKAFRRIVEIFRQRAANNVAFVWHEVTSPPGEPNWMDWYPGSDVVDWWGLSLFLPHHWESCPQLTDFITAAKAEGKPVMICESAPMRHPLADVERTWHNWFESYFCFVRQTPIVKGFCYINMDFLQFPEWTEWGDCRLHTSPEILSRYAQELRKPCYLHAGWWNAGRP